MPLRSILVSVVLIALTACTVSVSAADWLLVPTSPTKTTQDGSKHDDDRPKTPIDWTAGTLEMFASYALEKTGLEPQEAINRTIFALDRLGLSDRESQRYDEFDWKNSNPHTLLSVIFEAGGMETAEAITWATIALDEMGIQPNGGENGGERDSTDCEVYRIWVIWCEGEARKRVLTYMHKLAWDRLVTACPASGTYPTGQRHWYTLRFNAPCADLDTPDGTCIWITPEGSGTHWVSCTWGILGSNCFDELAGVTINCADIEIVCGDDDEGPEGCPDCDPE